MTNSLTSTGGKPLITCVCFSPHSESTKHDDTEDKEALWVKPPPANALDVAILLRQLGNDVILTGFMPKEQFIDDEQKWDSLGIRSQFIAIDNAPTVKANESSHNAISQVPLTVVEEEKALFNEQMMSLAEQSDCLLLTGDLPKGYTLQDFINLVKRLYKRNSYIFVEMTEKIIHLVHTHRPFLHNSNQDSLISMDTVVWSEDKRFKFLYNTNKPDNGDWTEVAFSYFEANNPKHIRTAIYAILISLTAVRVQSDKAWMSDVHKAYKNIFAKTRNAESIEEENKVMDEGIVDLLSILPADEQLSNEDIARYMAVLIIHCVMKDTIVLPTPTEAMGYQSYFEIKTLPFR